MRQPSAIVNCIPPVRDNELGLCFPLQLESERERGGEASPVGWAHWYLSAYVHKMFLVYINRKRESIYI